MIKIKKRVFIILIILVGLSCMIIAVDGCFKNWSLSSSYSKDVITLQDSSKVYVMLEEWGLHYKRISITQNPCGCKPANPDTDYIFDDLYQYGVDYKVTDNGLVIIGYDDWWNKPKIPWTKNKPTFEGVPSYMIDHPEAYGITKLRKHSEQWCFSNLFKASSSLRPDILEREWKNNVP